MPDMSLERSGRPAMRLPRRDIVGRSTPPGSVTATRRPHGPGAQHRTAAQAPLRRRGIDDAALEPRRRCGHATRLREPKFTTAGTPRGVARGASAATAPARGRRPRQACGLPSRPRRTSSHAVHVSVSAERHPDAQQRAAREFDHCLRYRSRRGERAHAAARRAAIANTCRGARPSATPGATQRAHAALPGALTSASEIRRPPATASAAGSMVRTWSQPTPAWRSASDRHSAPGSSARRRASARSRRRSSTTKSLPAPCILLKRRPAGAAATMSVARVVRGRRFGRITRRRDFRHRGGGGVDRGHRGGSGEAVRSAGSGSASAPASRTAGAAATSASVAPVAGGMTSTPLLPQADRTSRAAASAGTRRAVFMPRSVAPARGAEEGRRRRRARAAAVDGRRVDRGGLSVVTPSWSSTNGTSRHSRSAGNAPTCPWPASIFLRNRMFRPPCRRHAGEPRILRLQYCTAVPQPVPTTWPICLGPQVVVRH